jgi:hypothetical protein
MLSIVPNVPSATKHSQRQLSSRAENAWLRFDRNVSRELVYRRALAEVLIADTVQVAEDEFLLGTQLPRAHTLWSDRHYPFHDPLITIEVCRQACIAIPQRYYDVGPDWQFVSKQIELRVVNLEAFTDDETSPPEGILRARFSNKRIRHGRLRELTVSSELTIDGTSAATVSGDLMFFPRVTYQRLRTQIRKKKPFDDSRERSSARPVDPARVGRIFGRNVTIGERVLGRAPGRDCRYTAIVDRTHPCFFDHPLDHLPGALVIEVYRQAAIAAAASDGVGEPADAVVTRCAVQLSDFAELEAPIECLAKVIGTTPDGRVQIALTLHQLDDEIGDAHVELDFVPFAGRR